MFGGTMTYAMQMEAERQKALQQAQEEQRRRLMSMGPVMNPGVMGSVRLDAPQLPPQLGGVMGPPPPAPPKQSLFSRAKQGLAKPGVAEALIAAGGAMAQGAGWSDRPVTLAQVLGAGGQAGMQAYQSTLDAALEREFKAAQIAQAYMKAEPKIEYANLVSPDGRTVKTVQEGTEEFKKYTDLGWSIGDKKPIVDVAKGKVMTLTSKDGKDMKTVVQGTPEFDAAIAAGYTERQLAGASILGALEEAKLANDEERMQLEWENLQLRRDEMIEKQRKAYDGRNMPATIVTKMAENNSKINNVDEAIAAIKVAHEEGRSVGAMWKGFLVSTLDMIPGNPGNAVLNRIDPDGGLARAAVGDLSSLIIHDRSGAAVTAAESPRLMNFIPGPYDDDATIIYKLGRFKEKLAEEQAAFEAAYARGEITQVQMGKNGPFVPIESAGIYSSGSAGRGAPAGSPANAPFADAGGDDWSDL